MAETFLLISKCISLSISLLHLQKSQIYLSFFSLRLLEEQG